MVRVVVIGARRRRQGIGAYVARSFHECGAAVCAVVGTSAATAAAAREQLKQYGIACRAYEDLTHALNSERPDVVAVCTPYAVHRQQLEAAAAAGAHCLCEKPLWWGPGGDRGLVTQRLVDAFCERGRALELITQWPCSLEQYWQLFPPMKGSTIETFEMGLGPIHTGAEMILDAGPHVLSMLAALLGCGTVQRARARYLDPGQRQLHLEFQYAHACGAAQVSCRFQTCEHQPRPAWYGVNGQIAHRQVDLPTYSMKLVTADGQGTVDLPDPLRRHVEGFLKTVDDGSPADRRRLIESVTNLEILAGVG